MTPDVLCDLVEHMPPDASLWREMDPNTIWTLTDVLLALLSNQTAMANWQRGGLVEILDGAIVVNRPSDLAIIAGLV